MAAVPTKNAKAIIQDEKDAKEPIESPTSVITTNSLNAPKHGTIIPNRVFVGGICSATTEAELMTLFSNYGTVTGAKIIADRAGVSKGYGFVTFDTEEEAKRLQKDGYGRPPNYDCNPPTPIPMASQVFRQNGVPYTFHNGMAFFPQPQPQPITPQHMEPPTVYQQGTHYSAVPQGSPAPTYQYAYSQGQLIYQTAPQYPYHIPQYEGCYDPQVMMHEGSLVVPQYYLAPQSGHETYAYYPTTPIHPQEQPSPSLQHPIMYPSPRGYDSAILYTAESSTQSDASVVQVQEADTSATNAMTTSPNISSNNEITTTTSTENSNRRGRETPVVSLLKVQQQQQHQYTYKEGSQSYNGKGPSYTTVRRKPRQFEEQRRGVHLNNNNNSPDMANRNLMGYCPPPVGRGSSRRGSGASGEGVDQPPPAILYQSSNSLPPRPSVPTYPFYRHPPAFYPPPPPHRTRSFFHKQTRFTTPVGRGRGYHQQQYQAGGGAQQHRHMEGGGPGKWSSTKEEDGGGSRPLTPPITPKSEAGRGPTPAQQEELVKSIQAVAI